MTTRSLKLILALVLALFALYIFFYPPKSDRLSELPVGSTDSISTVIDTSLVCLDFNKYKPSSLQMGLISDMISVYRSNQGNAINRDMAHDDAEAVWFELDTIKKFIFHIEKLSKKKGVPSEKLGLRLYYATYPDSTLWGNLGYKDLTDFKRDASTRAYQLKHTIVMIPTLNIEGLNKDFNPLEPDTFDSGLTPLKSEFNGKASTTLPAGAVSTMGLTGTGSTTARNHGELSPPKPKVGAFQ